MSRTVVAVVRREYLQRVLSRWFLFSTVLAPLLVFALIVIPAHFAARGGLAARRITIVDATGVLAGPLQVNLARAGWDARALPEALPDTAGVRAAVREGAGAMLFVDGETLRVGRALLIAQQRPAPTASVALRQAVVQAALEAQLAGSGAQLRELLEGGELQVDATDAPASGSGEAEFVVAFTGAFVLYMTILIYAVAVMRSVLEEKTTRIVEIVLSSMRPWQLMLGKILGVGAVGLTQLAVWLAGGMLIATTALPALIASRPELAQLSVLRERRPGPGYLALFLVFFLGGYFLYSAIYAAVGAMCSSDEEAQQAQFPVMLLLMVPVVFLTSVVEHPEAASSVALSLVPFFSPVLMFARAAHGAAPGWQVGLSVVLIAASVVAVAWLAGRIYQVGILMTGKRPTLPELWRWVREG